MRAKLREIKETLRRHRHTPIDEQGQWLGTVMRGYFAYFAVPTNTRLLSAFRVSHQHRNVVPKSAATQPAAPTDVGADGPAHRPVPAVPARAAPVAGPAVQRQILEVGAECVNSARSDLCGGRSRNGRPYRDKVASIRVLTPFGPRKATWTDAISRGPVQPRVVRDRGMCRRSQCQPSCLLPHQHRIVAISTNTVSSKLARVHRDT